MMWILPPVRAYLNDMKIAKVVDTHTDRLTPEKLCCLLNFTVCAQNISDETQKNGAITQNSCWNGKISSQIEL